MLSLRIFDKKFFMSKRRCFGGQEKVRYRRLAWIMVDEDVAYASPATVHRVLVRHCLNTKFTHEGGVKDYTPL